MPLFGHICRLFSVFDMKDYFNGKLALTAALMALTVSCAREVDDIIRQNGPSALSQQSPDVAMTEEEHDKVAFLPGEAIIYLSEDMAAKVESSQEGAREQIGGVWDEIGVETMERLYPDAGKFEPRVRREGLHRFYHVKFNNAVPLSKARTLFENIQGVELFEKRRPCKIDVYNDPAYKDGSLWAFNSEKNPETSINVEKVWNYTMGDPSVIVCVVDEGIQLDHPDLAWNVCSDPELHHNFVTDKSTINPGDHGTHVSGTIAGVGNNKEGVIGVAGGNFETKSKGVSLMSAQVFDGNRSAYDFEQAIVWGADHGAVISSNSWGYDFDYNGDGKLTGTELSDAMNAKIDYSTKVAVDYFIKYAGCDNDGNQLPDSPMKGGLVVFAAGNDGIENGCPGSYEPIMTVAASNKSGYVSSFSNYGSWVDICAPGADIVSSVTGNKYAFYDGTSMACPHVSGAAALLTSFFGGPGFTVEDLEEILLSGSNRNLPKGSRQVGPYLDCWGSFSYGVIKYGREYNNPPVIETEYSGDFSFHHWKEVSIPFYVTDPDNDHVIVESSVEGRAKLVQDQEDRSKYVFTLLCPLVDDYTPKKVSIRATDIFSESTELEFTYKVLENRVPVASGSLPDIQIDKNDPSAELSFAGLFSDPDGEPLRFKVKSSNAKCVTAAVNEDRIVLTNVGPGIATVTLSALDHMSVDGAPSTCADIEFKVLIRPTDAKLDWYPNPVVNVLHVRPGINTSSMNVRLFNSTGAKVFDEKLSGSAFAPADVDMNGFAPGNYTIAVEYEGSEYTGVVVKI